MSNRRFVLARYPDGLPAPDDFRLETLDRPEPAEGQILVKNELVAVGPGLRMRLSQETTFAAPLGLGEVPDGAAIGRVVSSRNPDFAPGDMVLTSLGWQEYAVTDSRGAKKITDDRIPPSAWIGILGSAGLTAYFGMLDLGKPKAGETVLVSSAAGAVGSAAGQIAAVQGARVIGIAGGADKCRRLVEELGFDAAIDRKAEPDMEAAVARACPEGVDVLFDTVGNALIDAVIPSMKRLGRIVVVGQSADYNSPDGQGPGLTRTRNFITHRLTMSGLAVYDYAAQFNEAKVQMADWIQQGRLRWFEDVEDGFERLPHAFIGLFTGAGGMGRRMVRF